MANPAVVTRIANASPNAAPLTLNEMIAVLNPLITSQIQGNYIPYVISNTAPGPDDQDKAWIELDSGRRPISIRTFYNGNWRRIYNGMIGEVRMYSGAPGNPNFDSDGRGMVGGEYDGWQICNGKNNSPDLSDRFVVAAHMNEPSGWDGTSKWLFKITPPSPAAPTFTQTGGATEHVLVGQELPPINPDGGTQTPPEPTNQLTINSFAAKPGASHSPALPIVDVAYSLQDPFTYAIATYGADLSGGKTQTPVPTVPPYYALAFIIFQGYTT